VPEHLSPSAADGFTAGALSRKDRLRVLRHLLKGCPQCAQALAGAVGFAPAGEISDVGYDVALARARARVFGASASSSGVIAMLSSVLSGQRTWRDLSATEITALRGIPQVRELLQAGRSLRHQDPEAMLRLATLARYAADRLSPKEFGWEAVADLRALVWAELANAHRVCDELPRAGHAMNRAIHWFRRGSCSPLLVARIADLLASLLGAQRRLAESQEILALTQQVYVEEGQPHLAGRVLIKAGGLAFLSGAPGRAIHLMRKGLDLLEPEREPALVAQALRDMILCLSELGHFRSARRALWHSRNFFLQQGNALDLLRLRWLEGRIYAGLADFPRAETALEETRAGFAAKGQVYPAALAGLDLAALWTRQGRIREVYALADEIIQAFRALGVAREAIAGLVMMKHVCSIERGNRLLDVIQLVVRFLEELERQPSRARQSAGPDSSLRSRPPAR
jgi:hypothetical protein